MANIDGTLRGATCINTSWRGAGTLETWLLEYEFAAYNAAADVARVLLVAAAISARARDGKTRTLHSAVPTHAGIDGAGTAIYFSGGSVNALTISTTSLTGELNDVDNTEINTSGTTTGCGTIVVVEAE